MSTSSLCSVSSTARNGGLSANVLILVTVLLPVPCDRDSRWRCSQPAPGILLPLRANVHHSRGNTSKTWDQYGPFPCRGEDDRVGFGERIASMTPTYTTTYIRMPGPSSGRAAGAAIYLNTLAAYKTTCHFKIRPSLVCFNAVPLLIFGVQSTSNPLHATPSKSVV